jgi:hypothetical protein
MQKSTGSLNIFEEQSTDKHWLIQPPDGDDRDPATIKPNRHFVSEKQGHKVASILALADPGKSFVVYQAVTFCVAGVVHVDL